MAPATIGAAAIGSVCGWWCAPLAAARLRLRTWSVVAAAIAALWFESVLFGGHVAGIALLTGFATGFGAHAGFRAVLVARFDHHRS